MRQCENIFVFIDLTKSIGSDLGGQCPPRPPPNSAYAWGGYIFLSGRHGNWSLASFRFSIVAANHIIEKHMKCDF